MIKEAAILLPNGMKVVGKRHSTIYESAKKIGLPRNIFKGGIQGFVDDNGNFLNRKDAAKHAYECGQIKEITECLMSEDLY